MIKPKKWTTLTELLQELKKRAKELKLLDTNFLDRLIIDHKLRKETKVVRGEIPSQLEFPHWTMCEDSNRMTVKMLPNCVKYQGENNSLNWVLGLIGLKVRSDNQGGRVIGWLNYNRNRFLRYYFGMMGHCRDQGWSRRYWYFAERIMKNEVFIVTSLNHVLGGWEREHDVGYVRWLVKEVKRFVSERPVEVDFKRYYIPKDKWSDKLRPLGVPSVEWRIYLHMWNVVLVWWTMSVVEEEQHAYQPKKGVITAWKSLIERIDTEDNIYEFDLRNFFGSVNLEYNERMQKEAGIPERIRKYLHQMTKSIVQLDHCMSTGDHLDESYNREIVWNAGGNPNPNLPLEVQEALKKEETREETEEELLGKGYKRYQDSGVPQGVSTSCGLSILNLKGLFERLRRLLMYADDGLEFPDKGRGTGVIGKDGSGVEKAEDKSSWVKQDGRWLKSLKFVGLEYIPAGVQSERGKEPGSERLEAVGYPRLRSNTRNGATLEYVEDIQLINHIGEAYSKEQERFASKWRRGPIDRDKYEVEGLHKDSSLWNWIEKQAMEFYLKPESERIRELFSMRRGPSILSLMYSGSWDGEEYPAEPLRYVKDSWCGQEYGRYVYDLVTEGRFWKFLTELLKSGGLSEEEEESIIDTVSELTSHGLVDILKGLTSLFTRESDGNETLENSPEEVKVSEKWLKLLDWVKLSESNSSSLGVDGLLLELKRNKTCRVENLVKQFKPVPIKTRNKPKESEEAKEERLRKWRKGVAQKSRKELRELCAMNGENSDLSWIEPRVEAKPKVKESERLTIWAPKFTPHRWWRFEDYPNQWINDQGIWRWIGRVEDMKVEKES